MGRLFWKFFLFLFIAQLTTALAVGAFVQFSADDKARKARIDQSPISQSLMDAAALAFSSGGVQQLKALLKRWDAKRLKHQVFVVNQQYVDILDRPLPLKLAKRAVSSAGARLRESVMVLDINGEPHVMFVVRKRFNRAEYAKPPPPHAFDFPPPRHVAPPVRSLLFRAFINFPLKALLIAALASALFAAILAWYFSKPIGSLRLAFKQAAEGDLAVRVGNEMGRRNDALSDLGQHFDFMAERLNSLLRGQTRLLHHVSHELRSPLARMHMALGLAGQSQDNVTGALQRIEVEADRMDKLIGELLELSRFESGMVDLKKTQLSLTDLLHTIVDDAAYEASNKNIRVVAELAPALVYQGQEELLHRAFENLVRNAVKYAPNDSMVTVSLAQNEGAIRLQVVDQGAGVLENELDDIFKPFVRGKSGGQVDGHGVGLAIAKQVVEAHGGSIQAENLAPHGFCVSVMLPV